ncbi:hypothetical protein FRB99_002101 [Tulasnella sp. 403]|nr:hypothetical protein FRB99_002101 [Tulasnella sp. 403]
MKSFATILAVFSLSFAPAVLAHGHLKKITIDGTDFPGPEPQQQLDSAIRMVDTSDPVKDVNGPDMSCGAGAANRTATLSADAKPGSSVSFTWVSGAPPGINWIHNVGPMLTYLASCNGDCSKFQSLGAEWVKIDETGRTNEEWTQGTTLNKGLPYTMTLPADLPAGNYLLRHEIISLQGAQAVGGAEFYPACSQITVSGGAKGSLPGPTASFPGAYSATDPGIKFDAFDNKDAPYPFPGPDLAGFAKGANVANDSNPSPSPSNGNAENVTPSVTATSIPTTASGTTTCSPTPDSGAADPAPNDNIVTVTKVVTIVADPAQANPTATVSTGSNDEAAITPVSTSSPDEYRPKRRSRVMARRYF